MLNFRRWPRRAIALACAAVGLACAAALSGPPVRARDEARKLTSAQHAGASGSRRAGPADPTSTKPTPKDPPSTYAALATKSFRMLETTFYNGQGLWRMCDPAICNTKNRDWGADALTNLLSFRWLTSHDRTVLPVLRTLAQTAHYWVPGEHGSSDSVMWDAVADVRLYQATGSKAALGKAQAAIRWLGSIPGFASGACPSVLYQWPFGHRGHLKTIETASNYIKAALLLYEITRERAYLVSAEAQYALVRRYFLAPAQLYTAYMFDNGSACRVLPGRYFASVNGNMIWAGRALATATGQRRYLSEAVATARALQAHLGDGAGIFADLQADNDIVGPLVEAMYALATSGHQAFAGRWLLANASAAGADMNPLGEFGRFFDGPPPAVLATSWQTDGGIALMQAATALDPGGHPADPQFWASATFLPHRRLMTSQPVRIAFSGRAIAIMGTIGAICCAYGHASVLVDGVPTFSQTGIWQNMSSPARKQPDQVLFAWRWPRDGRHVITIAPASYDAEEGGSFFEMSGYLVVQ